MDDVFQCSNDDTRVHFSTAYMYTYICFWQVVSNVTMGKIPFFMCKTFLSQDARCWRKSPPSIGSECRRWRQRFRDRPGDICWCFWAFYTSWGVSKRSYLSSFLQRISNQILSKSSLAAGQMETNERWETLASEGRANIYSCIQLAKVASRRGLNKPRDSLPFSGRESGQKGRKMWTFRRQFCRISK